MANPEGSEFFDIYNLEIKLREKISELHWKTESLEEAQKELSELRRSFYETQSLLENERRESEQLRMQLKTADEALKQMEDEKIKNEAQNFRVKMNCKTAEIERNVLVKQAKVAKLENMELKAKIQDLEANNASSKAINVTLEKSLTELRNSVAQVHTTVHSNAEKLEREQEQLRKSVATSLQFGQRVQSILKTSHIARQRDKKTIEDLQKRVDDLVAHQTPLTTVQVSSEGNRTDLGTLHLKMESTLRELRDKLENNTIEDKLSAICSELRKVDGHQAKD